MLNGFPKINLTVDQLRNVANRGFYAGGRTQASADIVAGAKPSARARKYCIIEPESAEQIAIRRRAVRQPAWISLKADPGHQPQHGPVTDVNLPYGVHRQGVS